MTLTLTIRGDAIDDVPSFYSEINRIFMADEDWKLGESLDALDDMMRGGYGVMHGAGPVRLVWQAMDKARASLGFATTRELLQAKLGHPEMYNAELIRRQLAALEAGTGQTYFDIVLEIIAGHPNIELVPA